jgi:hypothetical protein
MFCDALASLQLKTPNSIEIRAKPTTPTKASSEMEAGTALPRR